MRFMTTAGPSSSVTYRSHAATTRLALEHEVGVTGRGETRHG